MSHVDIDLLLGENVVKQGIAFSNVEHPLIADIKFHWRDGGDFLSRQYTGTISTISKVSQDGKEGFFGKLNHKVTAVQRLFKNTISENSDQETIDIILGKHGLNQQNFETNSKMQLFINKELQK